MESRVKIEREKMSGKFLVMLAAALLGARMVKAVETRSIKQCQIDNSCKGMFDGDFFQKCNTGCTLNSDGYGVNSRKEREERERQRRLDEEKARAAQRAHDEVQEHFRQ